MPRAAAPLLLVSLVLAGCAASAPSGTVDAGAPPTTDLPSRSAPPTTSPPSPSPPSSPPPPPATPVWSVGASPLPLRADGFGEVLPTPEVLRDRRLPTRDLLPPPAGDRFAATVEPVSDAVRERMGTTWSPACPVALGDLRYLTVSFRGFDGRPHTGELVVAA